MIDLTKVRNYYMPVSTQTSALELTVWLQW